MIVNDINAGKPLSRDTALRVLSDTEIPLLDLVQAAYHFRKRHFGHTVTIHILNNVQNGSCPEDCRYCAQSTSSRAPIEPYAMKSDDEILREAAAAYQSGAGRYCMVFAGTGPSDERIEHLVRLITEIKELHHIEVCVSPGVINRDQARRLKEAGLDRLNHNLNTSPRHYERICTTHTYEDRLNTLAAAHGAGLAVCSGVIIGMGETAEDVFTMASTLAQFGAESIPVNFLLPIPGIALQETSALTPQYCLRVLCLFRFLNPTAEIRMAAGREVHLRSLEAMGLFVANSLFLQGYLNTTGDPDRRTLEMIRDAGFSIVSDIPVDALLNAKSNTPDLKTATELRKFK